MIVKLLEAYLSEKVVEFDIWARKEDGGGWSVDIYEVPLEFFNEVMRPVMREIIEGQGFRMMESHRVQMFTEKVVSIQVDILHPSAQELGYV